MAKDKKLTKSQKREVRQTPIANRGKVKRSNSRANGGSNLEFPFKMPRHSPESSTMSKRDRKFASSDANKGYAAERLADQQAKTHIQTEMPGADPTNRQLIKQRVSEGIRNSRSRPKENVRLDSNKRISKSKLAKSSYLYDTPAGQMGSSRQLDPSEYSKLRMSENTSPASLSEEMEYAKSTFLGKVDNDEANVGPRRRSRNGLTDSTFHQMRKHMGPGQAELSRRAGGIAAYPSSGIQKAADIAAANQETIDQATQKVQQQVKEKVAAGASADEVISSAKSVDGINETVSNAKPTPQTPGLLNEVARDAEDVGGFVKNTMDTISGAGTGKDKFDGITKGGGDLLKKMGGGNKWLGGAKMGGYVLGASMLVDMLNPFDDD